MHNAWLYVYGWRLQRDLHDGDGCRVLSVAGSFLVCTFTVRCSMRVCARSTWAIEGDGPAT
eukprot:3884636-Amphidinium_carterae.2